jgi:Calcineurin-like phosphoesterase
VGSTGTRLGIVVTCVLALATTAGEARASAHNLLQNGQFERAGGRGSLAGWTGVGARLTLRPDGLNGGHAALVTRTPGHTTYGIATRPSPTTTVAETRYRARAYLRSGRPGRRVCLRLIELRPGGQTAGRATECVIARRRWHPVPRITYTAKHTGDLLNYRIVQATRATAGDSFQVDELALTAPFADSSAPSPPTGLTATAASGSEVDLSWHAASDNVGVAGYTIYRGGTALATVGGSTLTYADTGVSSGHTYVYAVAASDAAGNRSARSGSVSVTTPAGQAVIAAAGDIACDPSDSGYNGGSGTSSGCRELATSNLVMSDASISAVLALGDDQYECGGYSAFQQSFGTTWGRFLSMIHPVPGNHEYITSGGTDCQSGAAGYFEYFGAAAGNPQGDYAWNIAGWHMIALNGQCSAVGGCGAGSPQGTFLSANLGTSTCTLAYWHQPYYTGSATPSSSYSAFWKTLYAAGADIVLNGHIHTYARFAPQDANGNVDTAHGIREFVVGTGGKSEAALGSGNQTNVEFSAKTFGILKLTLHPSSYDWKFVDTSGKVLDSGTAQCH